MRICSNCQAENPDDAAFCSKCGKPLFAGTTITMPGEKTVEPSTWRDPKHNGQATASLVIGIAAMVLMFLPVGLLGTSRFLSGLITIPASIAALVLGIRGLKSQKRGQAIAGICISSLGIVVPIALFIMMVIAFSMYG